MTTAGQIISMVIGIGFRYFDAMNSSLRTSLALAFSIATMIKLGVTHPPAGATAVFFATTPSFSWSNMGFMVIGNLVAIGSAMLFNNLSEKRQYPTSWGIESLQGLLNYFRILCFGPHDAGPT